MDVFSNTSAWLQHSPTQVAQSSSQVVQNDLADSQRPPNSTDWKDSSSTASGPNGASGNIDLHDFGLGDLSDVLNIPYHHFPFFNYTNNFFLPSVPPSYNAMSYGSSSWSPQPGQVPLSTYSTLNGATSANSPQSPSSHPSSQANIECHLKPTTFIFSNQCFPTASISASPTIAFPLPSIIASPPPLAPTLSQTTQSQSQSHSQSQQSQQSQGTLSPFALHAPQLLSAIPPSSFYAATPQSDSPVPPSQSRREAFLDAIQALSSDKEFFCRIIEFGILEVSAQTRLDILTKIRDNAGNNYFGPGSRVLPAMDVTREWLKAGATAGADNQVLETVMPSLHIADRLPFTGETLVSSKNWQNCAQVAKDAPIPAVKDMAANLERKWRNQFVFMQDQVMPADDDVQDVKQKKRKLPDAPSKPGPPAKKSAVSVASSSRPSVVVKKEGRPSTVGATAATMKESKSDSSFFSAPKQKPKLPSFKKAPGGTAAPTMIKKEPAANVAQPSSTDAFQEALKDMARARRPSPAAPAPSTSSNAEAVLSVASANTKLLKKKKSVTWAPDGQLELGTPHALHNVRELERGEGAALHAHLFEELLDWTEPQPIDLSEDVEARPRGEGSQERGAQEQRELTALGASYLVQPIPDSPADLSPNSVLSQEQVDENVVHMLAGAEIDALSWPPMIPAAPLPGASVAELVGQLAANGVGTHMAGGVPDVAAPPPGGFDPAVLAQFASSIPQEQLQQLAQMFATQPSSSSSSSSSLPQGDEQQSWDAQQAPAQAAFSADAAGGARTEVGAGSGRGRGRGRPLDGSRQFKSRIPCSFYAQGRCKYGDQCNFSHDQDFS
ncbi:hypothetical protein BGW80DRAFT_1435824 [Lactifluus volemus]|nr:hypothetical protein BGW80DRAFT_1435824 [Lactifluus volemus]